MAFLRLRRPALAVLAFILSFAAALRVIGVDHHLRYGAPDFDERNNFVDPVLRMWSAHTADPTVYYGYAGFFNYLIFLPVGLGEAVAGETGAYVAARAVVAIFATVGVLLTYLAVRPLAGEAAALAAAALLAVARIQVRHAHHITPDIVVGTAALALLILVQASPSRRRDVFLGATVGLATAVKYSGLLLAPAAALVVLLERRPKALAVVATAGIVAFAAAAPYAVVQMFSGEGTGFAGGVATYFGGDTQENRFLRGEGTSAVAVPGFLGMSLGLPALVLALASLASLRQTPVAAAWAIVAASVVATIPANLVNPRHVIPAETAVAVLFGLGLRRIPVRAAALAAAVFAVAWPLPRTLQLFARYVRPAAVDQAGRWIEKEIPSPALVVTSLPQLKLDRDFFEVRLVAALDEVPRESLRYYDVVVATTRREVERLPGFDALQSFPSEEGHPDRPVTVLQPPRASARPLRPEVVVPPEAGAAVVWDGTADSCWNVPAGALVIEARWTGPRALGRVEIDSTDWPQRVRIQGLDDRGQWRRLDLDLLRPSRLHRQRAETAPGQIFVLTPPLPLFGVRLERESGPAWSLCDVRLFEAPS